MLSIKAIANMAGVSRGTVDRVLNGRDGVSAETRKRVLDIIDEMSYSPNRLGKQLAIKKKNLKFGCVFYGYADENPYFAQVVDALKAKAKDLEEYGIQMEIRHNCIDEPKEILRNIDELYKLGIHGLIISPIEDPEIRARIDALYQEGIPVVCIGTDFPESKRLAYVGSNSYQFGMIAGNLMGLFTAGQAQVGIITGSEQSYNHQNKVQGFVDYAHNNFPKMNILARVVNNDRDEDSYACVQKLVHDFPGLNSIYFAAGGVRGGCQAIKEIGLAGKLTVVSFDLLPFNLRMLQEGVIFATIGQQPEYHVNKAVDILVDYLGMNISPEQEFYYSKPEITVRASFIM